MGITITISGQRGGNGRSTAAVNLVASLALLEKKTLLVDCDPQACSTLISGAELSPGYLDLSSVLKGKGDLVQAVLKTRLGFMDVIPSSFDLFHAAAGLARNAGKERILRDLLGDLKAEYDYIIIDPPPSYSFLTVMAMAAADWLIMPFHCTQEAVQDLKSLLWMANHVKGRFQRNLKIAGFFFNRCSSRDEVDLFLEKKDLRGLETIVFKSFIPQDEALLKASRLGRPAALSDIESPGARAYLDLAIELISFFN